MFYSYSWMNIEITTSHFPVETLPFRPLFSSLLDPNDDGQVDNPELLDNLGRHFVFASGAARSWRGMLRRLRRSLSPFSQVTRNS